MLLIWFFIILFPAVVFARVTPEDIVQSKREAYDARINNYSLIHKQQLQTLGQKIAEVNKKRTDELDRIMVTQATILDEYENRQNGKKSEGIKNARYWITFAHEAVAYQAAKIYIFNLSSESSIKNDALNLISLFQGELNSARSKVIYSQTILKELVKEK